jgi:uncharacterized RDD family membrane protein YckC
MTMPSTELPTLAARDQLTIRTPELVAIEFPLAGMGSRFIAVLLDYLLQALVIGLLVLVLAIVLPSSLGDRTSSLPKISSKWIVAIAIAVPFAAEWCYFALFEAFWRGQTPGKRIMHIRVIQQSGRPISLFESLARNLVRIIDWLPSLYVAGVISMFVTRRQQRLGDLIAGTLVVHERELEKPLESIGISRTITAGSFKQQSVVAPSPWKGTLPADAVALLTLSDLHALDSYLARRLDVPPQTRTALAVKLAQNISHKMNLPIPTGMSQETFLEETASALRSMPNLRR